MKKATETLSRQWVMLQRVPAYPRRISTTELHQYLQKEGHEIDIRTTQRDLDRLSSDFPLFSEKQGRVNYWQWAKGAHAFEVPSMTPASALVFTLVEQYLRPLLPQSTMELIQPYLGRAADVMRTTRFQGWRKNVRLLGRGPRLISPKIRPGVRDVVYTALMERSRFNVKYSRRYEKKAIEYSVNPLGLVIKEGISYVVCTLRDYDDLKQLALHRIQSASLDDEPAKRIKGFDLDTYIEKESGFAYLISKDQLKLKARFENDAAFHLQESRLSTDQELKQVDKDSVLLTATVPDSSEIRWWLLGFGDQVEVLEPKKLRNEFAKIAENLHGHYSG